MRNQFLKILAAVLCCSICCLDANAENADNHRLYLGVEAGCAFSLDARIDVNNSRWHGNENGFIWDATSSGWSNRLGQTFGYGVVAGYNLSDLLSLELAYNNRPSFQYKKFQSVSGGDIGNRTRNFDLQNKTVMLNGVFHLASVFDVIKNFKEKSKLEPFISLGAGISENKISNFHSMSDSGVAFSKMTDKTVYKFAAQAGLGLNYNLTKQWAIKSGYRFIYGGKIETQDYVTDDPDNQHETIPGSGNAVYSWKGTLKANEIYLGLTYSL